MEHFEVVLTHVSRVRLVEERDRRERYVDKGEDGIGGAITTHQRHHAHLRGISFNNKAITLLEWRKSTLSKKRGKESEV